jgi:hypothetical protein
MVATQKANFGSLGGRGRKTAPTRAVLGFVIWTKGLKGAEAAWCEVAIRTDTNHEHWRGKVLQCSPVAKEHQGLPLDDLVRLYPLTAKVPE